MVATGGATHWYCGLCRHTHVRRLLLLTTKLLQWLSERRSRCRLVLVYPFFPPNVRRRPKKTDTTADMFRFSCIGTSAVGGATLANVNKNSLHLFVSLHVCVCVFVCLSGGSLANRMPFYYDGLFTKNIFRCDTLCGIRASFANEQPTAEIPSSYRKKTVVGNQP